MAWHGNVPWHGLGNESESLMTTNQALERAGLDWPVQMGETFIRTHTGEELLMHNTYGSYRRIDYRDPETGELTGESGYIPLSANGYTATGAYQPIQNQQLFGFIDDLVQEQDAIVETCGALHNGNEVWVMARLPGHIKIGGSDRDTLAPYLLITTRHDGAGAVKILPTTVRVVCSNTLGMALRGGVRGKGGLTVAHRGDVSSRIEQARRALGIVNERFVEFGEQADLLTTVKVTKKQGEQFFLDALDAKPTESSLLKGDPQISSIKRRQVDDLMDNWLTDPTNGVNGMRKTLWGLINAMTNVTDHKETQSRSLIPDFSYGDTALDAQEGIQSRNEEDKDGNMVHRTNKVLRQGDVRLDKLASTMMGSLAKRKTLTFALALARGKSGTYDAKPTLADAEDFLTDTQTV